MRKTLGTRLILADRSKAFSFTVILSLACSPKLDMADANSAAECYQALEQVDFECRSCWRMLCGEKEGRR